MSESDLVERLQSSIAFLNTALDTSNAEIERLRVKSGNDEMLIRSLSAGRAATIEECAGIADVWPNHRGKHIAKRIRALAREAPTDPDAAYEARMEGRLK